MYPTRVLLLLFLVGCGGASTNSPAVEPPPVSPNQDDGTLVAQGTIGLSLAPSSKGDQTSVVSSVWNSRGSASQVRPDFAGSPELLGGFVHVSRWDATHHAEVVLEMAGRALAPTEMRQPTPPCLEVLSEDCAHGSSLDDDAPARASPSEP